MVKYLVENGAKVTTRRHRGEKAVLYWACRKGNESIVEFLLRHGAKEDVHDHDSSGRSCFGKACYEGNTALVRTFLTSGIDIRREAELLCHNNEIANMLRLELHKSTKHREKVQKLKELDDGDLTQVGPPLKRCCTRNDFSLGKGSEGTHVYVGIMEDDSSVAVKRILLDNCKELAENENTILNLIKTEHSQFVVKYRGFLKQSPFMYLILDLCEESLEEHVKSKPIKYLGQYGPRMIKQIFSGLEFLHGHNILHRDLKPLNVLVDIAGGMRLADFGLSRVLDDDQTTCYTFAKGTKNWMPPEVIEAGNVDNKGRYKKKSDVYVAGMISFFILTKGKHPFGDHHARMKNILNGKPVELKNLNDLEAEDFVSWLIRHNIDERPYADEVVGHPFLKQVNFNEELSLPRILLVRDSD